MNSAKMLNKSSDFFNSHSQVRVGDHFCGSISYSENQIMYSVNCEGAEGDKVTLSKLAFLSLCEVQVFGKYNCTLLITFTWVRYSILCNQRKGTRIE